MASPLPPPYDVGKHAAFVQPCRGARPLKTLKKILVGTLAVVGALHLSNVVTWRGPATQVLDAAALAEGLAYCVALHAPKSSFGHRISPANERADSNEPSYLLVNATIWTGTGDVIQGGDVLLRDGLIQQVSASGRIKVDKDVQIIDAAGRWLTPGIVDLHSHMGVGAAPGLSSTSDSNSHKSPIQPYLRSIDGFSTVDLSFKNSILGGVTTMQVLPGSANNIGGQAFVFKPRVIPGGSPSDMALESPFPLVTNGSTQRVGGRWRHVKFAQGENIKNRYESTRTDQGYWFRQAFEAGRKLKIKEDNWCKRGKDNTEPFPIDLQWELLADAIRGNVKINVHTYQGVDLDFLARLTNEFKFPIAAIHHASEAYLVPNLLKKFHGGAPVVAQFATHQPGKWEAFRGSEYAPSILADAGIVNVLKSDHPVLDSRYLAWEAAQAHHFGLNWTLALGAIFSAPAEAAGLAHRVGRVVEGLDADVVLWDSFPLNLGATPVQVFIDGVKQFDQPHVVDRPSDQSIPPSSSDSVSRATAVDRVTGKSSYAPTNVVEEVVFTNVRSVYEVNKEGRVSQTFGNVGLQPGRANVVVRDAVVVCTGSCRDFTSGIENVVDLRGGSLIPGLVTYGGPLGVSEIGPEPSTNDGNGHDVLAGGVPVVLKGDLIRGVEALSLGQKFIPIVHNAGILTAVSHPTSSGLVHGLSTAFRTSATSVLQEGAIVQEVAALHTTIAHGQAGLSISEQIRALRDLLLGQGEGELGEWFGKAANGELPLVVAVNKADHIAGLISAKRYVEKRTNTTLRLVLQGAQEAHLLADDLAKESIGVIVTPPRSAPGSWDTLRILPGPPATEHTLVTFLASAGVKVAIGHSSGSSGRHARFDALWNSKVVEEFTVEQALELVGSNVAQLLGLEREAGKNKLVAIEGDFQELGSRVVGILDGSKVELY